MRYERKDVAIGDRFGRLSVTGPSVRVNGKLKLPCKCECGSEVLAYKSHLKSGLTKSCGCLNKQAIASRNRTHGASKTPEYRVWRAMLDRCFCPSNKRFDRYGGRGITVCERWRGDFAAFLSDMGVRPYGDHTLERLDPDMGYEPGNCVWALMRDQARNKSKTKSKGSGYVGVTETSEGRWMARIGSDYSVHYLGTYETIEEAVSARRDAESRIW